MNGIHYKYRRNKALFINWHMCNENDRANNNIVKRDVLFSTMLCKDGS